MNEVTRFTFNITSRAAAALELANTRTGDTSTDSINRAIQVYAHLTDVWDQGGLVYVQREDGGPFEKLTVF